MAKILNIKEGINVIPDLIDAIANGYRDDVILDELAQAIEDKVITRQQFETAVDGLDLYAKRFINSVQTVAEAMRQFEFNDEVPVLKNKRLNLAEQVMQDIDGFNAASEEFDNEVKDEENEKESTIDVSEAKASESEAAIEKPSYKEYFMKKLDELKVVNPRDLTPEQWAEIDKGAPK